MTTTELVVDPFADVAVGNRASRNANGYAFNDPAFGIWTRSHYTWCGQNGPTTGHLCSRPVGHPAHWSHVAASETAYDVGDATIHEIWGTTETPTPPAPPADPDPHAAVTVGPREIPFGDTPEALIYTADSGKWCSAIDPSGKQICSRMHGHNKHWSHIASTPTGVLAVWGGEPITENDPFAHVTRGAWVADYPGYSSSKNGIRARGERCGHTEPELRDGTRYPCTRPPNHYGLKHIGTSGDQVFWDSPNTESLIALPFQPEPEPDDDHGIDPLDIVCTELPPVGHVVRMRDRNNRMYVMSHRVSPGEVELLDLTHNQLRAVPLGRLVVETQTWTTIEELQQVTAWFAAHRNETRKVAIREYKNGRWCMAGLNEQLANLGMEQYEPSLTGEIVFTLPFEHENIHANKTEIQDLIMKEVGKAAVKKALIKALPQIKDLDLDPERLNVRATNFGRS